MSEYHLSLANNIDTKWDSCYRLLNLNYSQTPDGIFLHEDTLALDSAMAHGFFALPKIVT